MTSGLKPPLPPKGSWRVEIQTPKPGLASQMYEQCTWPMFRATSACLGFCAHHIETSMILSLSLCFPREVRWNSGAHSKHLEPQIMRNPASHCSFISSGKVLSYPLPPRHPVLTQPLPSLTPCPKMTVTLCPLPGPGQGLRRVDGGHVCMQNPVWLPSFHMGNTTLVSE